MNMKHGDIGDWLWIELDKLELAGKITEEQFNFWHRILEYGEAKARGGVGMTEHGTGAIVPLTQQAAQKIRNISDLPWVNANENWGAEGTTHSNIRFIYNKEKRTTPAGKTYISGGLKHWKWDLRQAVKHFGRAFTGKPDSIDRMLHGKMGFWKNFGIQMYMTWYYIKNTELERPDAMVTGTTLHGVWAEEAWHAALWSPVVALAVADWLETADPNDDHALRVAKLVMDAPVFFKGEDDDD